MVPKGREPGKDRGRGAGRRENPRELARVSALKMKPEKKAPTGFIGNVGPGRPDMDLGWQTPPEILRPARQYWGGQIPFDVCTTALNPTGAKGFWTPDDDGLAREWPEKWWKNPPYGRSMATWLKKSAVEKAR